MFLPFLAWLLGCTDCMDSMAEYVLKGSADVRTYCMRKPSLLVHPSSYVQEKVGLECMVDSTSPRYGFLMHRRALCSKQCPRALKLKLKSITSILYMLSTAEAAAVSLDCPVVLSDIEL